MKLILSPHFTEPVFSSKDALQVVFSDPQIKSQLLTQTTPQNTPWQKQAVLLIFMYG